MWKVGDTVRQRPGIFRIEEVAGKDMTITHIQYPRGKDRGWPLEVVTEYGGKLYRWKPEALQDPHVHLETKTTWGGSSWE